MSSAITCGKAKPTDINPPDWGEDPVSRRIMDLTGVQLIFGKQDLTFPWMSCWPAAKWTDLVCVMREAEFYRLENGDICYSLDELANSYCPDFWDDVDPLERLNNQASDGHIYTLRVDTTTPLCMLMIELPINPPWTMNIRTDKLEKLGPPCPLRWRSWNRCSTGQRIQGLPLPIGCTAPPRHPWPGGWA